MYMKCQIHDNNCFNGGGKSHNSTWPLSQEAELVRSGPSMSVFKDAGSPFTQASVNNVFSTTEGLCERHTLKNAHWIWIWL